jgi:hypothetical protein
MTSTSYKIFSPLIKFFPLKFSINILYLRRFRKFPDLKNPKSFNEKLQYRKLFDRNNLLTIAADKLKSKDYVKNKNLEIYIPKVLWEGDNIEQLNLNTLPSDYVFKANHASRTNLFIQNNAHYDKEYLKKTVISWFKHDQSKVLGEWAYKNINKKVFIEEFLNFENSVPDDYKFFVYHGKVKFIQLDMGRFKKHQRNMFDEHWNDLNIDYSYERMIPSPSKPIFIDKMIDISEKIGKDFDFIRVDLYFYKDQITFGELTVYPGAGYEIFPEEKWDIEFGKYWEQNYEK